MHDIHEFLAHHGHGHVHADDDDNDSMPSLEDPSPTLPPGILNPLRGASDDPDEEDISRLQFRQVGPGRFAVTGTYVRTMPASPPPPPGGNPGTGLLGGVASIISSLIGGGRNTHQGPTGAPNADSSTQNPAAGGQGTPGVASFSGTTPGGHRFTYTAGARLHPRDPNNPGPFVEPVDELQKYVLCCYLDMSQILT